MLAPLGLTPTRLDLRYVLLRSKIPPNQTEIADALGVSRPVITRMVQSLVEIGLVRCFGGAILRDAIVEVKKPVDREVPERFGAARGLFETLVKWEERFMWWQQTFSTTHFVHSRAR